jgi:cutinase
MSPSPKFMKLIDTPPVEIGALYAPKTIDLCIANDPICAGEGDGANHALYNKNGMTDQAATFVVSKL